MAPRWVTEKRLRISVRTSVLAANTQLGGKLVVDCTGEGAVFVAAEANCAIEAIGDITTSTVVTLGKLVYDSPSAERVIEIHPLVNQGRGSVPFGSSSPCAAQATQSRACLWQPPLDQMMARLAIKANPCHAFLTPTAGHLS
ncbi:Omega-hydroxypalmitate O-feruloyl transferase [Morella rubra]|uniref:Omega-hydroxypalmitate O-feruloyl transferase n=1 Tax=Morella rubra TaxID=262757 RepID=A0A6A1WBM2_9ROSI|nr:Omega-hydroxypalmitate O-feruloyl transferase [Morella rubra]